MTPNGIIRRNMIQQYLDRVSVRDFDKKPMPQKDIDLITKVINNSPTSTNAQQFSAIIVTDPKLKAWIGKNNWGQQHIADSSAFIVFVGDRTRTLIAAKNVRPTTDMLFHEFHRAVVDATIAATYTQDALIEMGYGVTFVGGIVAFADELAKKLNLPESAHIVVGLSIGKGVKINGHKPKVNKVFMNKYNKTTNRKELMAYDKEMQAYYTERGAKGDFLKSMEANQDPKGSYAPAWKSGGKYISKTIKNYK